MSVVGRVLHSPYSMLIGALLGLAVGLSLDGNGWQRLGFTIASLCCGSGVGLGQDGAAQQAQADACGEGAQRQGVGADGVSRSATRHGRNGHGFDPSKVVNAVVDANDIDSQQHCEVTLSP